MLNYVTTPKVIIFTLWWAFLGTKIYEKSTETWDSLHKHKKYKLNSEYIIEHIIFSLRRGQATQ